VPFEYSCSTFGRQTSVLLPSDHHFSPNRFPLRSPFAMISRNPPPRGSKASSAAFLLFIFAITFLVLGLR